MIARMVRYLTRRERRRRLGAAFIRPYNPEAAPRDGELLMLARAAKDPHAALELLDDGQSIMGYIRAMPRQPARWRARLIQWLRHILGLMEYEPYKSQRARRVRYWEIKSPSD